MNKTFRKAVLVSHFTRMAPAAYNEIYSYNYTETEVYYLIHPDCDDIHVEVNSIVIFERVENFLCERWKTPHLRNTIWRIVTDE